MMDWQGVKSFVVWVFSESHNGRIGRLDYLKQRLMLILAGLTLAMVLLLLSAAGSVLVLALYVLLLIPVWFLLFYRNLTLDIQRLHDLDLSGWWLLLVYGLTFIPFFGLAAGLVAMGIFLLVPGTVGPNRFGVGGGVADAAPRVRNVTPVATSFAQMVQAQPAPRGKKGGAARGFSKAAAPRKGAKPAKGRAAKKGRRA